MSAFSRPDSEVLIVGAGPTGLVLALWLTRLGVPVRIIDKAAELGTTSRAMAVQARTLEFHNQIGIAKAAIDGGVKVQYLNLWVRGKTAAQVSLWRIGEGISPYPFALSFAQDAHERLLIDQLAALGVRVERQTELRHFEQDTTFVRATLSRPDGSEEHCTSAFLAGCDGASSTVREQLRVGFPGGTYTGLFYVADVDADGEACDDQLHIDLEEADFALVFPLKAKGRVRLIGLIRDLPESDVSQLTFKDVEAVAVRHLGLSIERVHWFSTYRVHHRVANRFRAGRVFLLGDAAHIHSPVGGQGMNTGIGDAVNLAWKLALGATEPLLATYELERIAFARRLVKTTDRVFTFVTRRGTIAKVVRTRLVPALLPLLFQSATLRNLWFKTVSQTGIHYHHSPLSMGKAGGVRGGDRLPWVEIEPGQDNFARLTSLGWQVHVYGEAADDLRNACEALGLPLHCFPWQARMRRAGLKPAALYLIRPDGYVALADTHANPTRLRDYVQSWVNLGDNSPG